MKESKVLRKDDQQAGSSTTLLMIESSFFERISAYMAENESKAALEAEINSEEDEKTCEGTCYEVHGMKCVWYDFEDFRDSNS